MVARSLFGEGRETRKVIRSRSDCVEEDEEKDEEEGEESFLGEEEGRDRSFIGGGTFLTERRGDNASFGQNKEKNKNFLGEGRKHRIFLDENKEARGIVMSDREESAVTGAHKRREFISLNENKGEILLIDDNEYNISSGVKITKGNNNESGPYLNDNIVGGSNLNDNSLSLTFLGDNNTGRLTLSENVSALSFLIDNKGGGNFFTDNNNSDSWLSYTHNYSPELKRDTEVIFEEKIINERNGDLENYDYSDRSPSPENSISSNENSSSSSSDSSSDETVPAFDEPTSEKVHTYRITSEPYRDIQEIFKNFNEEEFLGNKYYQPPKPLDRDAAKRLARRLYECDGFKITDVAKHLSKRNDFSQIVGEEFANHFDLSGFRLDRALRLFLSKFTLTGETQERERIMHHFSKRYVTCNYDMYNGEDACHTLVCALIILNTNLHSQNQPKMSCNDFIMNLKDLNEGENFSIDNLKEVYSAIEQEPIRWPMDDELVGIVNVPKQELVDFSKQMINPPFSVGFDLPRDANSRNFMSGYVVRKWLKEHGGKKAAFGKRGWKLFYGRLRDLTLYLYKDHDKSVTQTVNNAVKHHHSAKLKKSKSLSRKQSTKSTNSVDNVKEINKESSSTKSTTEVNEIDISLSDDTSQNVDSKGTVINSDDPSSENNNASDSISSKTISNLVLPPADTEIHINHAYASRAVDYVKKKNVFRIKTKYGSEYLFQVNTEKELDGWIENINYVAALLSDPEPTIGICTMEKLSSRSIPLPKITTLNVRDQLENHQKCLIELEKVIKSLKENTPKRLDKKSRSELEESIKFREDELQRYKTYCQLLEFELIRIQNIVNIRISAPDSSYFYQPFQKTGPTQSTHLFNQGIIVNQQMLNTALMSSDNYINNFIVHSQPNVRFRPPVHQNLAAMSVNRRLRSRQMGPLIQTLQPLSTSQITQSMAPPAVLNQTEIPPDNVYSSPTNNTFYEIV